MEFVSLAKYLRFSPTKLRPIADVVRGKPIPFVLGWLSTYATKRVAPIKKVIESAVANAKNKENIELENLRIKEIRVDEGPMSKYFKPGAMGRSNVYRKRTSHVRVILEPIGKLKE